MKYVMVTIFLMVLAILNQGCISTMEHERYLDSLINRNINDVLTEWGPPSRIIPDPKGYGPSEGKHKEGLIYVWDTKQKGKNVGYKMLWVDAKGYIHRADIQGEKWLGPKDVSNKAR